jgi:hypothetical protein
MPTATRNRPRAHRTGPGRYARGAMNRTQGLRRRRRPQPTGVKGMLMRMPGRAAATRAAPSSKKGKVGGLALAAAAAGAAFTLARKGGRRPSAAPPSTPAV